MIQVEIREFPFYETHPREGITPETDSNVFDLEFFKEDYFYEIKSRIVIHYNRYYYDGGPESPIEDYFEVTYLEIEPIKGSVFKGDDEHILGDKELRKITKYLTENIEFI